MKKKRFRMGQIVAVLKQAAVSLAQLVLLLQPLTHHQMLPFIFYPRTYLPRTCRKGRSSNGDLPGPTATILRRHLNSHVTKEHGSFRNRCQKITEGV
jgi:hypothetical protein